MSGNPPSTAAPGTFPTPGAQVTPPTQIKGTSAPNLLQQAPVLKMPEAMSRPYTLPSLGLAYGGALPGGNVEIKPIVGEHEEKLAGAGKGAGAFPVLRHVVEQLCDTRGFPFGGLLFSDFVAVMCNIFSYSYEPVMRSAQVCPHCDAAALYPLALDPETAQEVGIQELPCKTASADDEQGPFQVMLNMSGATIDFRLLTVNDTVELETYQKSRESASDMSGNNPLHIITLAKHVVGIDGHDHGLLRHRDWLRRAHGRDLTQLRDAFKDRETGYDIDPEVTCDRCSQPFSFKLPLQTFFRREGA